MPTFQLKIRRYDPETDDPPYWSRYAVDLDGHRSVLTWKHLRANCPCAGCREEREKPPDPFRILKSSELVPLAPVAMTPVGRYAYKIVWSDGHDTGIFTLEHLRALCQCPICNAQQTV